MCWSRCANTVRWCPCHCTKSWAQTRRSGTGTATGDTAFRFSECDLRYAKSFDSVFVSSFENSKIKIIRSEILDFLLKYCRLIQSIVWRNKCFIYYFVSNSQMFGNKVWLKWCRILIQSKGNSEWVTNEHAHSNTTVQNIFRGEHGIMIKVKENEF